MIAIFTAGGLAILVSGFGTPILLRWLTRNRIGQHIREDGPATHASKAGTPTMGGIALVASIVGGYFLAHVGTSEPLSSSGLLVIGTVVASGGIGFIDDGLKVRRRRSLGLNKRAKIAMQFAVALAFAFIALDVIHVGTSLSFTRYNVPGVHLASWLWVIWVVVMMVASSNAVNLTDGLDGLAAGSSAFAATGFALIGYWEYRHFSIYKVGPALDLALAAIALGGACLGFLWWNAAPARIFMGDTGSLAIGSGLASFAILMNVQLLLPIIGGLFVIETVSVAAQVVSFRCFHRRIFRMAPLHHHFELLGWPETTVIVRFWMIAALCTAIGLGVLYADFLGVHSVG
ncbi:MAG TPA: phospho-N-acetylmuramoyl-pentapeptide-transferase [Acidimicrobiales bacterium]|nr:phospho-N-acetylmuramoyl-pentapeptide-transferase [Acidimicrobiales bacterium]